MSPDQTRGPKDQMPRTEEEARPEGAFPPFDDPAFASGAAGETAINPVRAAPEPVSTAPRDTQYAGHPDFSQDAAGNEPPKGFGNSEAVDDDEEVTRHADGVNPPRQKDD